MRMLEPLGDQAVLARFADEQTALAFAGRVWHQPLPGLVDVVQAYTTVAVHYDLEKTSHAAVAAALRQLLAAPPDPAASPGRMHHIPCCYDLHLDLERIAQHLGMAPGEVVRLHAQTVYVVYAIGFCPGFPYLGYLPSALCGVPRLPAPRVRVEAGSVGLTGRQTGIYTEPRPGGWNLIGRTPLTLVDVAEGYFPLRTGDQVRFVPIDLAEFERLRGSRLEDGDRRRGRLHF